MRLAAGLACSLVFAGGLFIAGAAQAASCADLWYQRNLIYAQNGYCFQTDLGKRTFANFDCWTSNPHLSRGERQRVQAIKAEERRRGCKVN
ncbi:YARHG domain-containing protein [Jiella sp. M17.18]|uniref:YARHG domain-containing protein n=1 Tax=Jiella sp. M17.18 TaxID=3234247 RepID=UPI0034DE129E